MLQMLSTSGPCSPHQRHETKQHDECSNGGQTIPHDSVLILENRCDSDDAETVPTTAKTVDNTTAIWGCCAQARSCHSTALTGFVCQFYCDFQRRTDFRPADAEASTVPCAKNHQILICLYNWVA